MLLALLTVRAMAAIRPEMRRWALTVIATAVVLCALTVATNELDRGDMYGYGYLGVLSAVCAAACVAEARRVKGLVGMQWLLLFCYFACSVLTYGIAAEDQVRELYLSGRIRMLLTVLSDTAMIIALSAFNAAANRLMRILDVAMALLAGWMFYIAAHDPTSMAFGSQSLLIGLLLSIFMGVIAVMSYRGSSTREEASFAAAVALFSGFHMVSLILCNLVADMWLHNSFKMLDAFFVMPEIAFCVMLLYQREQRFTPAPVALERPSLMMRNMIPSTITAAVLMLTFYTPRSWQVMASITVAVVIACYMIRTHLLQRQMMEEQQKLASRIGHWEEMANRDALTGLYNRRALENAMARIGAGGDQSVALLLVDMDRLKPLNDNWGHRAGDEALAAIGAVLDSAAQLQMGAMAVRIGGDEFAVLLTGNDYNSAQRIAEHILLQIQTIRLEEIPVRVSVSIGIGVRPSSMRLLFRELVKEADEHLYRAKGQGGNRVRGLRPGPINIKEKMLEKGLSGQVLAQGRNDLRH